jgi:hypothetical protein
MFSHQTLAKARYVKKIKVNTNTTLPISVRIRRQPITFTVKTAFVRGDSDAIGVL